MTTTTIDADSNLTDTLPFEWILRQQEAVVLDAIVVINCMHRWC